MDWEAEGCAQKTAGDAGDAGSAGKPARKKTRAPRDPERRKRQIVEAAAGLIAQEGTQHLTHRRVAERAGVPLGSTTQYFESIDELRRAGLMELSREFEQRNREMMEQVSDEKMTADALTGFVRAYLADADQMEADAMFYAAAVGDPEVRGVFRNVFASSIEGCMGGMELERLRIVSAFISGIILDTVLYGMPFSQEAVCAALESLMGERG